MHNCPVRLGKSSGRYVLAVIPGDRQVDLRKVNQLFGGSRAHFATTESAEYLAYLAGIAYAFVAAVLYALASIIAKSLAGVRPHVIALVQVLVGIPLLFPFARFAAVAALGLRWGWLIGLGVIHTCLMYILIYSSFQKLTTIKIGVLSFIYPAVAVLADYVVFAHRLTLLQALGMPLIVGAVLGVNLDWNLRRLREIGRDKAGRQASGRAEDSELRILRTS
jgi:drug/metabolite transporter (DMT)-like permease